MTGRLKRRSSLGVALHAPPTPPTAGLGALDDSLVATDDESERRIRRGRQKGRASLGTPIAATPAHPSPGTPSAISGYSAAQLADHYTNCMKLSAENKISMKNAFQLKLIDYMAEMLKKKNSDLDNFQTASCALDASTKIYGYRVDSVHNETMKLASGVGYNAAKSSGEVEGQSEDNLGNDSVKGPVGAGKKAKKRSSTVEKNLKNINCTQFELDYEIDPLFKKMSLQFDGGNGGGQFLSTLHMKNDSCEMLLDSRAKFDLFDPLPENPSEAEELSYADNLPNVLNKVADPQCTICPSFAGFSFRHWNVNDADEDLNLSQIEAKTGSEGNALENEEHAFQPLELEDDYYEAGEDNLMDEGPEEASPSGLTKPHVPVGLLNIQSLRDHLSSVPSEYSYFDQGRLGAWAGPKHWKFKPMTKAPLTTHEARKAARKKEKEKMDFHQMTDGDTLILSQVQLAMRLPKKATKLQHKTMQNWSEERNILPEDLHYSGKDFVKLESMIKTNLAPRKPTQSQSVDDSVADYDFDNLNDTQNFCPDLGSGENNGGEEDEVATMGTHPANAGDDDLTHFFSQTVLGTQEPSELGLVAAPNRVEKIQIGYAKQAKKVDMRKLKSVEWSIILDRSRCGDPNKENEVLNDQATTVREVWSSSTRFSDLYRDLQGPNKLPSKMVDSLSVPLAFVALLHLCNEQNLALENMADFSDLSISKA